MRASAAFLLLAVTVALTGCSSPDRPSQVSERDLTTSQVTPPNGQVASAVELNLPTAPPVTQPSVKEELPHEVPELDDQAEEAVVPAWNIVVTSEFTPAATPTARPGIIGAIAPGETVRIIPTNFPSRPGEDEIDVEPEPGNGFVVRVGSGGSCQPRGVGGILF